MDAHEELGQQMMRDLVILHSLIDAYARTRDHRIRRERDRLQEATEVKMAILRSAR